MHPYIVTIGSVILVVAVLAVIGQPLAERGIAFLADLSRPLADIVTGGFTITSIDDIDVIVNNQVNPNGIFRITAIANRGAESIYGTISPTGFEQETGISTDETFEIKVQNLQETARYSVTNYQEPLWDLDYIITTDLCSSSYEWQINDFWNSRRVCVKKYQRGTIGDLSLTSIRSDVDVTVKAGNKASTTHLSSDQTTGTWNSFGSLGPAGSVQWTGGLATGNLPPEANDWVPFYDTTTQYWKAMTSHEYNTVTNEYINIINDLNQWSGQLHSDFNIVESGISTYRSEVFNVVNSDDTWASGFEWTGKNDLGASNTYLSYELPISTVNPQLVFDVNAIWIGVKVYQGVPMITNLRAPLLDAGNPDQRVEVTVRNAGQSPGSFNFELVDCTSFQQKYSIVGEQFNIEQTRTVNIPITSTGSASETCELCAVRVCDQGGGGCDQKTIQICQTEARLCTEGTYDADRFCIFQCINNKWQQQECCEYGTKYNVFEGTYECQQSETGGEQSIWDIILRFLMLWVIGIVIGVVAIMLIGMFIPQARMILALNVPYLILAVGGIGLLIAFIFSAPVAMIAASIGFI